MGFKNIFGDFGIFKNVSEGWCKIYGIAFSLYNS